MRTTRIHWRRTKIVCTIGPATSSEAMIRRLILAGMDVARLNMSHGTMEEHAGYVQTVRKLSKSLGVEVSVLLDLPGPKYRIGALKDGHVTLRQGSEVTITERQVPGDAFLLPVNLPELSRSVRVGQTVLLDDGALQLRVIGINGTEIKGRVTGGGTLVQGRGLVVPGMPIVGPFLTDSLRQLVDFAIKQQPDYIALSFVSRIQDIKDIKGVLDENSSRIPLVAKIERQEALHAFDGILEASDAVMVARGDLGVEIPLERVPLAQKDIIRKCNRAGKPVITATEMLQSMVTSRRPMRAETTDVANAIFDGTDAIMLSAETSIGKYPVEAVRMMDRIARETEKKLPYDPALAGRKHWVGSSTQELISYDACLTAHNLGARAIVAFTQSGSTAGRVSKYRPQPVILAITATDIAGRLELFWGVHPIHAEISPASVSDLFEIAADTAKSLGIAKAGDLIVVTGGIPLGEAGSTNLLKVEKIK